MMRIIALALLIAVVCRWIFGKWPWEYMQPVRGQQRTLAEARKLLEIDRGASRREIRDAHRRKTAMIHPDKGGANADMQDLNAARDLLLNELSNEKPEQTE